MRLIIDIPDDIYKRINGVLNDADMHFLKYIIAHGTTFEERLQWIPITERDLTEEEKELYKESLDYVDDMKKLDCPLPDDGQEVLITYNGETEMDTFYRDEHDGCYFEWRDIGDVRAWMPKPKPYSNTDEKEKS